MNLFLIILVVVIVVLSSKMRSRDPEGKSAVQKNKSNTSRWHTEKAPGLSSAFRRPRSTDGHALKKEQDITCRQFGHRHPEWEEPATRYIVHDDPEDGYIILNGKMMKRTEADAYENTI